MDKLPTRPAVTVIWDGQVHEKYTAYLRMFIGTEQKLTHEVLVPHKASFCNFCEVAWPCYAARTAVLT